jgi:hypothetical protein
MSTNTKNCFVANKMMSSIYISFDVGIGFIDALGIGNNKVKED